MNNHPPGLTPEQGLARLTVNQIEYLLLGTLRIPVLFDEARSTLTSVLFDPITERQYRMLWNSALALAEAHGGVLPAGNISNLFNLEIEKRRLENPASLDDDAYNNLMDPTAGLVPWIFNHPLDQINEDHVRIFRIDFLRERQLDKYASLLSMTQRTGMTKDRQKELEESWTRIQMISNVTANEMLRPVMDESLLDAPPDLYADVWSTGLSFVDTYMNGGQRGGEAYTLMGPSGVGKTTLALQMCIEAAKMQRERKKNHTDEQDGIACYFTGEMSYDDLVSRAWSYAAEIHSDTLKNGIRGIRSKLSTRGKLIDYETERFRPLIDQLGLASVEGELERLMASMRRLKDHLFLSDMAGIDPRTNQIFGTNGIDDVVMAIRRAVKPTQRVAWIAIDYAGIVVDRYMAAHGISMEHKRHYLNKFVLDAITKIAVPYKCPVWCLHQLNGPGNKKAPGQLISHTEAAEATAFAHNAWFAFQLSNKDQETHMCRLFCTKTRRASGSTKPPVLRVDGAFSQMVDISKEVRWDAISNRFQDVKDNQRLVSAATINRTANAPKRQRSLADANTQTLP